MSSDSTTMRLRIDISWISWSRLFRTPVPYILVVGYAYYRYRAWHALGGGGLPHNLRGWLMNVAMHPLARRDVRVSPPPYEGDLEKLVAQDGTGTLGRSFFGREAVGEDAVLLSVPVRREGPRPTVPGTVAPQRQTDQTATPAPFLARQEAFLSALARGHGGVFVQKASALESPAYQALWLDAAQLPGPLPEYFVKRAPGEWCHVHPEGSTHVYLSLVDAREVVWRGWGERHKLSGVKGWLGWGFVLVYAPRTETELAVWREIVMAGARFVSAGVGRAVEAPA
ncbi:hypothetical protein F5Y15DRAFT_420957 [Xylariaceae sp. FL0016]|nr:hypothetical protein F5Y15DRAFT_420957 [Xylariaceae sp. FL0016]